MCGQLSSAIPCDVNVLVLKKKNEIYIYLYSEIYQDCVRFSNFGIFWTDDGRASGREGGGGGGRRKPGRGLRNKDRE